MLQQVGALCIVSWASVRQLGGRHLPHHLLESWRSALHQAVSSQSRCLLMPSLISSELQYLPAVMEGNALGVEEVGHDFVQVFLGSGCSHQAAFKSLLTPILLPALLSC